MARPQKEGLDYFPLDVEMDDKVKLIDAKLGAIGFGILVKLWQIIYANGYYIKWAEKELLLYKNRINADINLINDVINECLKWDIFNQDIFDKYNILTSKGIQKRFIEAVKRRQTITLTNELFLIEIPENFKPCIKIIPITIINANRNSKNADIGTQSKVKKSKVKKSIKNIVDKPQKFIPPIVEEVKNYCQERNNNVDAEMFIDFYSSKGWIVGKSKMKDWKAAVRTWEKRGGQNGQATKDTRADRFKEYDKSKFLA